MSWELLAMLVIKEGLPIALRFAERMANSKNQPVTLEEIAELRAEASKMATDRARLKLLEMGIDLESDRAKELLALTASI